MSSRSIDVLKDCLTSEMGMQRQNRDYVFRAQNSIADVETQLLNLVLDLVATEQIQSEGSVHHQGTSEGAEAANDPPPLENIHGSDNQLAVSSSFTSNSREEDLSLAHILNFCLSLILISLCGKISQLVNEMHLLHT